MGRTTVSLNFFALILNSFSSALGIKNKYAVRKPTNVPIIGPDKPITFIKTRAVKKLIMALIV